MLRDFKEFKTHEEFMDDVRRVTEQKSAALSLLKQGQVPSIHRGPTVPRPDWDSTNYVQQLGPSEPLAGGPDASAKSLLAVGTGAAAYDRFGQPATRTAVNLGRRGWQGARSATNSLLNSRPVTKAQGAVRRGVQGTGQMWNNATSRFRPPNPVNQTTMRTGSRVIQPLTRTTTRAATTGVRTMGRFGRHGLKVLGPAAGLYYVASDLRDRNEIGGQDYADETLDNWEATVAGNDGWMTPLSIMDMTANPVRSLNLAHDTGRMQQLAAQDSGAVNSQQLNQTTPGYATHDPFQDQRHIQDFGDFRRQARNLGGGVTGTLAASADALAGQTQELGRLGHLNENLGQRSEDLDSQLDAINLRRRAGNPQATSDYTRKRILQLRQENERLKNMGALQTLWNRYWPKSSAEQGQGSQMMNKSATVLLLSKPPSATVALLRAKDASFKNMAKTVTNTVGDLFGGLGNASKNLFRVGRGAAARQKRIRGRQPLPTVGPAKSHNPPPTPTTPPAQAKTPTPTTPPAQATTPTPPPTQAQTPPQPGSGPPPTAPGQGSPQPVDNVLENQYVDTANLGDGDIRITPKKVTGEKTPPTSPKSGPTPGDGGGAAGTATNTGQGSANPPPDPYANRYTDTEDYIQESVGKVPDEVQADVGYSTSHPNPKTPWYKPTRGKVLAGAGAAVPGGLLAYEASGIQQANNEAMEAVQGLQGIQQAEQIRTGNVAFDEQGMPVLAPEQIQGLQASGLVGEEGGLVPPAQVPVEAWEKAPVNVQATYLNSLPPEEQNQFLNHMFESTAPTQGLDPQNPQVQELWQAHAMRLAADGSISPEDVASLQDPFVRGGWAEVLAPGEEPGSPGMLQSVWDFAQTPAGRVILGLGVPALALAFVSRNAFEGEGGGGGLLSSLLGIAGVGALGYGIYQYMSGSSDTPSIEEQGLFQPPPSQETTGPYYTGPRDPRTDGPVEAPKPPADGEVPDQPQPQTEQLEQSPAQALLQRTPDGAYATDTFPESVQAWGVLDGQPGLSPSETEKLLSAYVTQEGPKGMEVPIPTQEELFAVIDQLSPEEKAQALSQFVTGVQSHGEYRDPETGAPGRLTNGQAPGFFEGLGGLGATRQRINDLYNYLGGDPERPLVTPLY